MAAANTIDELNTIISSTSTATSRIDAAVNLTNKLLIASDLERVKQIVETVFGSHSAGGLLCRPILKCVAHTQSVQHLPLEKVEQFWIFLLDKLKGRVGAYDDEEAEIRKNLSALFEKTGKFGDAAKCLASLEIAECRRLTPEQKFSYLLHIADLYIRADDIIGADCQISRAKGIGFVREPLSSLSLDLEALQATLFDRKHQHLEAAQKYFELSKHPKAEEVNKVKYLFQAALNIVLAPAGPFRSRLLTAMLKEDRLTDTPSYKLIQKIFSMHFISPDDFKILEGSFSPHHFCVLPNGQTPFQNALLDHNVQAAAQFYSSISFKNLANFLYTTPEKAERVAACMIRENRLPGAVLDGANGYLKFRLQEFNSIKKCNNRIYNILTALDSLTNDVWNGYNEALNVLGEGRRLELDRLVHLFGSLTQQNLSNSSDSVPLIQILGLPGVGKTLLIKTFLEHANTPFSLIDCNLASIEPSVWGTRGGPVLDHILNGTLEQLTESLRQTIPKSHSVVQKLHLKKLLPFYRAKNTESFFLYLSRLLSTWASLLDTINNNGPLPVPVLVFDNHSSLSKHNEVLRKQLANLSINLPSITNDDCVVRKTPDIVVVFIGRKLFVNEPEQALPPPTVWLPIYEKHTRDHVLKSVFPSIGLPVAQYMAQRHRIFSTSNRADTPLNSFVTKTSDQLCENKEILNLPSAILMSPYRNKLVEQQWDTDITTPNNSHLSKLNNNDLHNLSDLTSIRAHRSCRHQVTQYCENETSSYSESTSDLYCDSIPDTDSVKTIIKSTSSISSTDSSDSFSSPSTPKLQTCQHTPLISSDQYIEATRSTFNGLNNSSIAYWNAMDPIEIRGLHNTTSRIHIHINVLQQFWNIFVHLLGPHLGRHTQSDFHETLFITRRLWGIYLNPLINLQESVFYFLQSEEIGGIEDELRTKLERHIACTTLSVSCFTHHLKPLRVSSGQPATALPFLLPVPSMLANTCFHRKAVSTYISHKRFEGSILCLVLLLSAFIASITLPSNDRTLAPYSSKISHKRCNTGSTKDLASIRPVPFTLQRWLRITHGLFALLGHPLAPSFIFLEQVISLLDIHFISSIDRTKIDSSSRLNGNAKFVCLAPIDVVVDVASRIELPLDELVRDIVT